MAPTDLEGVAIAEAGGRAAAGSDATLAAAMAELERLGEDDEDAWRAWRKLRARGCNPVRPVSHFGNRLDGVPAAVYNMVSIVVGRQM